MNVRRFFRVLAISLGHPRSPFVRRGTMSATVTGFVPNRCVLTNVNLSSLLCAGPHSLEDHPPSSTESSGGNSFFAGRMEAILELLKGTALDCRDVYTTWRRDAPQWQGQLCS